MIKNVTTKMLGDGMILVEYDGKFGNQRKFHHYDETLYPNELEEYLEEIKEDLIKD